MQVQFYSDNVNKILPSSGRLRPANQDDMHFLPYWNIAFSMDCGMGMIDVRDAADKVNRLRCYELWLAKSS